MKSSTTSLIALAFSTSAASVTSPSFFAEQQTSLCNIPGFDLVAGITAYGATGANNTFTVPFDNNFHDVFDSKFLPY